MGKRRTIGPPMTEAEKRAYQRGYRHGQDRCRELAQQASAIAKGYRDRAEQPPGRCAGCSRWTHGGGGAVWGYCAASFEFSLEPRMWAERHPDHPERWTPPHDKLAIITTQDFTCPNWLPTPTVPR